MTGSDIDVAAEVGTAIQTAKMTRADGLSFLHLSDPSAIRALPPQIGRLDWMAWLDLEGTGIADLSPIASLTRLQRLDLRMTGVADLSPLSGMTRLTHLFVEGAPVRDLTPLSGLCRLQELWLSGTAVTDLAPLSTCTGLRTLVLSRTRVSDLTPLAGLPDLASLDISDTGVDDLTPILNLPGFFSEDCVSAISFANTPAIARDPALQWIACEEDDPQRRAELLVAQLTGGTLDRGWKGNA